MRLADEDIAPLAAFLRALNERSKEGESVSVSH
jgi:hypothetical protein